MKTTQLSDPVWKKIYQFLKAHPNVYAGDEERCRLFVEGINKVVRTGVQWRELPEKYGNWNSSYKRFSRWEEKGVWAEMHEHFASDPDMECVMLDGTVIRAHMCASGGSKKTAAKTSKL